MDTDTKLALWGLKTLKDFVKKLTPRGVSYSKKFSLGDKTYYFWVQTGTLMIICSDDYKGDHVISLTAFVKRVKKTSLNWSEYRHSVADLITDFTMG